MSSNSTRNSRPAKPYDDFPLYAHPLGYWSKKINGKIIHFGRWGRVVKGQMTRLPYEEGWRDALASFKARVDDAHAGRILETVVQPAKQSTDEFTVKALCNQFLTAMYRRLKAGKKMSPRMFAEYRKTAEWLSAQVGKNRAVSNLRPSDFEQLGYGLAEKYGVVRQGNEIQKVRTMFRYAAKNEWILREPNYGSEFSKPDKGSMRKNRRQRLFTAEEIRWLLNGKTVKDDAGKEKHLAGATGQLHAMILLGINCAFGNADCSDLQESTVNLKKAWVDYPRPKTGIDRRCPLWPETVAAIKAALTECPKPKDKADADCVFITSQGNRWVRNRVSTTPSDDGKDDYTKTKVVAINSVGLEFGKVLKRLGINGRQGLGFYSLRHTFRTIADATLDFPAVRLIMGHVDSSIDAEYREHIGEDRLRAVVEHVHAWLFGQEGGAK